MSTRPPHPPIDVERLTREVRERAQERRRLRRLPFRMIDLGYRELIKAKGLDLPLHRGGDELARLNQARDRGRAWVKRAL
jgi:hypothetical protein